MWLTSRCGVSSGEFPRRDQVAVTPQSAKPPWAGKSAVGTQTQRTYFHDLETGGAQQADDLAACEEVHRQAADTGVRRHLVVAAGAAAHPGSEHFLPQQPPARRGPHIGPAIV